MSANDTFQTPLNSRYASPEMKQLWSPRTRFSTWRKLWLWLAQSEKELGLAINDDAIKQLEKHVTIQDEEFKGIAEEYGTRRNTKLMRAVLI
jgi:adenylosuccinate lyase